MIEQALRFETILRLTANTESFRDGLIDSLLFGGFGVDHLQCLIGHAAVDFLELEISLQASSSNRLLLYFVGRITKREALIIEIPILPQPRDHDFHHFLVRVLSAEQSFAQFRHRARLGCQQLDRALKSFTSQISHV